VSDLQCPARFVLVPADAQPEPVDHALAHDRVAEVRTDAGPEAVGLGRTLAARWGLPVPEATVLDAASYRDALGDLADLRRGETTVVVVAPELLALVAGRHQGDAPDLVELQVDADGWAVRERGAPPRPPARPNR
jgi:hypothetical protein